MKRIAITSAFAVVAGLVALFAGCSGSDGVKEVEETQEDVNTGNEGSVSDDENLEDFVVGDGGIVQSYVSGYMRPTGISVWTVNELYVKFRMDVYYLNREESDVFKEKYNDLSYYQLQSVPVFALCDGVTSLAVETVGYYDESHPAGSDISDMVYCEYLTYYEFIAGGYVPIEKDERYSSSPLFYTDYVGSLLHGMWLSEVNYGNSQMMTKEILIKFPVAPEAPGTYEFRFFFNMPDLALETTFEYEFE